MCIFCMLKNAEPSPQAYNGIKYMAATILRTTVISQPQVKISKIHFVTFLALI